MRRRDTLRTAGAALATGTLLPLAGCSGSSDDEPGKTEQDDSSLTVESFDFAEGESGNLVVPVTVKNTANSKKSGTLYVTVKASKTTSANGSEGSGTVSSRESTDVTVPAGETKDFELSFEFTYEQFKRKGSLDIDLRT